MENILQNKKVNTVSSMVVIALFILPYVLFWSWSQTQIEVIGLFGSILKDVFLPLAVVFFIVSSYFCRTQLTWVTYVAIVFSVITVLKFIP